MVRNITVWFNLIAMVKNANILVSRYLSSLKSVEFSDMTLTRMMWKNRVGKGKDLIYTNKQNKVRGLLPL